MKVAGLTLTLITNLCYEDVLAVVLDGHGKITPSPRLIVVLEDR